MASMPKPTDGFPESPMAAARQKAEDAKNARMRELLDKAKVAKKPAAKKAPAKKSTAAKPARLSKPVDKVVKPAPKKVAAAKKVASGKKRGPAAQSDNSARAREEKVERKPSVFLHEAVFQKVLDRLVGGETLTAICSSPDMPTRKSIYEWISADKELERRYSVAVQMKADKLIEETLDIADDKSQDTIVTEDGERPNTEFIQRAKLRVEARWKYAAAVAPKKYGARSALDVDLTVQVKAEELDDRIQALLSKAAGGR